jgi:hypothetical protein
MNGLMMKYFVLKPKGKDIYAQASRKAMRVYADYIEKENQEFAKELHEWANFEQAESMEVK